MNSWYLSRLLTLFPGIVEVIIDGKTTEQYGDGGFSQTWFTRGMTCDLACGARCCKSSTVPFEWVAFEPEIRWPRLEKQEVQLNGKAVPVYCHINQRPDQCDFLQEDNLCSIHHTAKSDFCRIIPMSGVYQYQGRGFWFKRRSSRNWRWPQCIGTYQEGEPDIEGDLTIFQHLVDTFRDVPGWDPRMDDLVEYMRGMYHMPTFYKVSRGKGLVTFSSIMEYFAGGSK